MAPEKIDLKVRIFHWFTSHPWLKLIALVLAIMVWFYIGRELEQYNY
ncbi:MAG: hypothetical protein WC486_04715 [Candidatus Omnitrophota bacterium]|jgi:predicted ABC-type sugar transport system permease subunit